MWDCGDTGIVELIWDCGVNVGLRSQCGIVESMWDCGVNVGL